MKFWNPTRLAPAPPRHSRRESRQPSARAYCGNWRLFEQGPNDLLLLLKSLRDGNTPAHAKRFARHLETRGCLAALVFAQINKTDHPPHGCLVKTGGDD